MATGYADLSGREYPRVPSELKPVTGNRLRIAIILDSQGRSLIGFDRLGRQQDDLIIMEKVVLLVLFKPGLRVEETYSQMKTREWSSRLNSFSPHVILIGVGKWKMIFFCDQADILSLYVRPHVLLSGCQWPNIHRKGIYSYKPAWIQNSMLTLLLDLAA